jgi:hypothetical protein
MPRMSAAARLLGVIAAEGGLPRTAYLVPHARRWPSRAADLLGRQDAAARQAISQIWDLAFEQGRLAALDELQDRFCVCMK